MSQQRPGWMVEQQEQAKSQAEPASDPGFCRPDILALLGQMAHYHLLGCIGVGEALKGVTVAGFDGIKPGLLDWKA